VNIEDEWSWKKMNIEDGWSWKKNIKGGWSGKMDE